MSLNNEVRRHLFAVYVLWFFNCILYFLSSGPLKPTLTLRGISLFDLLSYSRVLNQVVGFVGYLIVSLIHLIASLAITRNIVLALMNRALLIVQLSLLGFDRISYGVLIREFAILVFALFILRVISHGSIPKLSTIDLFIGLKNLVSSVVRDKESRVKIDAVVYMLSLHSLALSLLILWTFSYTSVQDLYAMGGVLMIVFAIIPLLQIGLLTVISRSMEQSSLILLMSAISGTGLLGTIPMLMSIGYVGSSRLQSVHAKFSKLKTTGLYMGTVLAELTSKKTLEKEEWYWSSKSFPLYLDFDKLNTPHVIIIGSSGTGKTTLAKHIVQEAKRKYNYNVIIIDLHGEYHDLQDKLGLKIIDASSCGVNPLALGNASPKDRAMQVAHIISTIFDLGPLQRRMIEEVIMEAYNLRGINQRDPTTWSRDPPTLQELVEVCKRLIKENFEYSRIIPYLEMLSENLSTECWLSVDSVLEQDSLIDLSRVASDFAKTIFIDTLMYLLLNRMYTMGKRKIQLLLDEARSLMPRAVTREIISRLFVESRKFGFSLIVISQEIGKIPRDFVNNAGARVFFLLNDPKSVEEASKILSGTSLRDKVSIVAEALRTLRQHTYLIHITGLNKVYIVSSPIESGDHKN
ncbi:MAG: ATP-binding protein [Desulfurococcaceae archaeon]